MKELLTRYTCPSCWTQFEPEKTHWIATSDELLGDDRLGKRDQKRFLPRHFTSRCKAVDSHGGICEQLACPYCHLEIPAGYFEAVPFLLSVVGGRASGKSFFIVSLIRWMKQNLSTIYGLRFEGEPYRERNTQINEHIENLFTRQKTNKLTTLEGDKRNANAIMVRIQKIHSEQPDEYYYPLPAMYAMSPSKNKASDISLHYLCVYDHAGEDFEPGVDNPKHPLTKHIGNSNALFFVLDPTQDADFREMCDLPESDENDALEIKVKKKPLIVFTEMIRRIYSEYTGESGKHLSKTEQYDRPIVVVVTKCDTWKHKLEEASREALKKDPIADGTGVRSISKTIIDDVSSDVHRLIRPYFSDLVGVIDGFASDVKYIPVSATGKQAIPRSTDNQGQGGYVPGSLEPIWVGVPFLYALAKQKKKLVDMK